MVARRASARLRSLRIGRSAPTRPISGATDVRARPEPTSADLILLAAVALWGLNYTVVKVGLTEIQPLAFPVFRFGVGGLVLLLILGWREGSVGIARSDIGLLALAALLGITLSQISFVFALTNTSASDTALLAATAPIVTAVLATLVGLERMGRRHWLATVVGLAGAVLIVVGGVSPAHLGTNLLGDGLALGNVVGASASALPIMPLLRRYSALRVLTWEMLFGTVMLLPVALPSLVSQDYVHVSTTGWAALGYAVIFSGIVTNLLYFTAIGRVGPSRAALYQYVQTFLAVLFAVLLLNEHVTLVQLVGGAIVVGSVRVGRPRRSGQTGIAGPPSSAAIDDARP